MPYSTPPHIQGYLCVGVIIGAHGIQGEVKLKPFLQDFSPITQGTKLISDTQHTFTCQKVKTVGQGKIALTLQNVTTRNAAEDLQGTALYIPRALLGEEEIYADVIKLPVHNHKGEKIGTTTNIFNNGAHAVLEIELLSGHEVMLPYTDDYAKSSKDKIMLSPEAEAFLTL